MGTTQINIYNISHFLQIWAFPPGLILLLFFIGFFLIYLQQSFGKALIIGSLLMFWLFSTPIVTQQLIDGLQNQYPPLSINMMDVPNNHAAIVVLGSGVEKAMEYANQHIVSDMTLRRLNYTAYLYGKIHLPVIVSGGNRVDSTSTEADSMREVLLQYHVPVMSIENKSRNTQEEAMLLAPILKSHDIHRIYLITHACHMPRSMISFKNSLQSLGISVIPAPTGYINLQTKGGLSNYLPLLNALNTSVYALHEYVGILWYRLFYLRALNHPR